MVVGAAGTPAGPPLRGAVAAGGVIVVEISLGREGGGKGMAAMARRGRGVLGGAAVAVLGVEGGIEQAVVIEDGGVGGGELVQGEQHIVDDGGAGGMLGGQGQIVRIALVPRLVAAVGVIGVVEVVQESFAHRRTRMGRSLDGHGVGRRRGSWGRRVRAQGHGLVRHPAAA